MRNGITLLAVTLRLYILSLPPSPTLSHDPVHVPTFLYKSHYPTFRPA